MRGGVSSAGKSGRRKVREGRPFASGSRTRPHGTQIDDVAHFPGRLRPTEGSPQSLPPVGEHPGRHRGDMDDKEKRIFRHTADLD